MKGAVQRVVIRFAKEFANPEALQEYLRQHPKADRSKHTVKPDRSPPAPKEPSVGQHPFAASIKVTPKEVTALAKKHSKAFDSIAKDGRDRLKVYHEINGDPPGAPHWKSLSEPEQIYLVAGHLAGKEFLKTLSPEETKLHEELHESWIVSSQADASQTLHGLLESWGVRGTRSPDEVDSDKVTKLRGQGKGNKALADYVKKAYAFQQAFYEHIGLKEMTLFRGVRDKLTDRAETGTPIQVQTREAASFSSSPHLAQAFGRVVEYKVPVAHMLFSGAANPRYAGERETIILGGSDLVGRVQAKSEPKDDSDE